MKTGLFIKRYLASFFNILTIGILVIIALLTARIIRQNRSLAQENKQYTKCIATIFATYTRDNKPVNLSQIEDCTKAKQ